MLLVLAAQIAGAHVSNKKHYEMSNRPLIQSKIMTRDFSFLYFFVKELKNCIIGSMGEPSPQPEEMQTTEPEKETIEGLDISTVANLKVKVTKWRNSSRRNSLEIANELEEASKNDETSVDEIDKNENPENPENTENVENSESPVASPLQDSKVETETTEDVTENDKIEQENSTESPVQDMQDSNVETTESGDDSKVDTSDSPDEKKDENADITENIESPMPSPIPDSKVEDEVIEDSNDTETKPESAESPIQNNVESKVEDEVIEDLNNTETKTESAESPIQNNDDASNT